MDLFNQKDFVNVAVTLDRLINIEDISKLYPFFYRPNFMVIENGWDAFDTESEYKKLVSTCPDEWRFTNVNKEFQVNQIINKKNMQN